MATVRHILASVCTIALIVLGCMLTTPACAGVQLSDEDMSDDAPSLLEVLEHAADALEAITKNELWGSVNTGLSLIEINAAVSDAAAAQTQQERDAAILALTALALGLPALVIAPLLVGAGLAELGLTAVAIGPEAAAAFSVAANAAVGAAIAALANAAANSMTNAAPR